MNKTIKKLKNQRGSALLLTLGILSLVLIMAMSFAFSARTSRQVAKVNADQVKARLLAESALERVIAAMKYNYNGDVYPSEQDAEPSWPFQTATGTDVFQKFLASPGSDYQIKGSSPTDPPTLTEMALPIVNNFTSPTAIGFQRVDVDPGTGAETIGRIAFLVLEEANKLDINQMVTLRMPNSTPADNRPFVLFDTTLATPAYTGVLPSLHHNFANIRGDFLYDISATELTTTSVSEANTVRLGLNMQEIRIDGLYRSSLPAGFPGTAAPSAGTRAPWFSYRHLWNVAWDTTLSPTVLPISHALRYTFFSGEDIEAYWDGTDERQRFDITGFEWGSSTGDFFVTDPVNPAKFILNPARSGWHHAGTLAGAQTLVNALVADDDRELFWDTTNPSLVLDSPTVGDTGFGIPYLKDLEDYLKDLEDATANHGKQVAANMVDFCDGDYIATTSADYETKSNALSQSIAPAYFGNEKVPYINEFALSFIANKPKKDPDDLASPYVYSLKFRTYFELANVFAEQIPPATCNSLSYTIQVSMSVTCDNSGTAVPVVSAISLPLTISSAIPSFTTEYKRATTVEDDVITAFENSSADLKFTISISKIVIVIHDSDDNVYDLAYLISSGSPVSVVVDNITSVDTLRTATWEVYDPRYNHPADQWVMSSWAGNDLEGVVSAIFDTNTPPGITGGALNSVSTPDTAAYACDAEDYSTVSYSTAFIPNRPFQSLWELGAIHRGERFRTINLTAYSATGGTYADGDAAILDQVKIGPLKRTRGKFNLNSNNPAVTSVAATTTRNLLSNIDVTVGYEGASSTESNTVFSPSALAAPSFSRGECATMLHYDVVGATDRQREAFIGRTANLLTTRMDKYTVLVVGEALKRIELPPGLTVTNGDSVWKTFVNPVQITIAGTPTWFSILGKQKMLAHIVRDAWRNEYKVVQMQLLED